MAERLEDHYAYQAGYRCGQRYIADVIAQGRVAVQELEVFSDREIWDLIELAAGGYVPDDLHEQMNERVAPEVRTEFDLGFVAACQDHVFGRELGTGEN